MLSLPKSYEDLGYILGGSAASVLLFLVGPVLVPFLAGLMNFAVLPLLCLGLGRDDAHQFYASLLSALCVALFAGIQISLFFSFMGIIPAFLVGYLALLCREGEKKVLFWYPVGRLLTALTAYSLGLAGLFFLFFLQSDVQDFLHERLLSLTSGALHPQYSFIVGQLVTFLPAVMTIAVMLTTLMNAILAQAILVKFKRNQRPTPRVADIELSWGLWVVLAVFGVAAFVFQGAFGRWCMNETLVLSFSFLFQGLGVVHVFFARYFPGKMFHWIFYIGMIVFGWLILIVILLGIFEPWVKLRKRFTRE